MVKTDPNSLKSDLEKSKENTTIRIKAVEKQEGTMREKAKKLQEEVMKKIMEERVQKYGF